MVCNVHGKHGCATFEMHGCRKWQSTARTCLKLMSRRLIFSQSYTATSRRTSCSCYKCPLPFGERSGLTYNSLWLNNCWHLRTGMLSMISLTVAIPYACLQLQLTGCSLVTTSLQQLYSSWVCYAVTTFSLDWCQCMLAHTHTHTHTHTHIHTHTHTHTHTHMHGSCAVVASP